MKKLLGLITVTAVVWLGSVGFISGKVEGIFDDVLATSEKYMAQTMPYITYQKNEFTQGFFNSTATSVLTIDAELFDGDESIQVPFKHIIHNGPLLMTDSGIKLGTSYIESTLDIDALDDDIKDALATLFANEEPVYSAVTIGFDDRITEAFKIAAINYNSADFDGDYEQTRISIDGVTGLITTDADLTKISGQTSIGAMHFSGISELGEKVDIAIESSEFDIDITEMYKGAMLAGSMNVKMPKLSYMDVEHTVYLNNLTVSSTGENDENLYASNATIDIDEIIVKAQDVQVLPATKLHTQFGFGGMDKVKVQSIIDAMNMLQTLELSEEAVSEQQLDAVDNYLSALGHAIEQGVEINTVFELSNEKGIAAINFDTLYVDNKPLAELKTIKDLVLALKGLLKIEIDHPMIADTPLENVIQTPISMGFAARIGDTYSSTTRWNKGEVTINSQDFPLLDIFANELEQPLPWVSDFSQQ